MSANPAWSAPVAPVAQVYNIAAIGDSLTLETTWCTVTQTWPYLLGVGIGTGAGGGTGVTNLGVNGNTIAQMRARIASVNAAWNGAMSKNILYVMGGTNDINDSTNIAATLTQLSGLCADALAVHPWLIIINTLFDFIPRAPNFDAARLIYNDMIRRNYLSLGAVGYCDPGLAAGMLVSGAPNAATYFGTDHGHPNPAGNIAMTVEVQAAVMKVVAAR